MPTAYLTDPSSLASARLRWTVVTCALALAFAAPAEAQLGGRLKKLGKDAVKEAAKGATKGTSADSAKGAGAATAAAGSSAAGSASADYAITGDRVQLVLAAIAPATEQARIAARAKEESAAYQAAMSKFERCLDGVMSSGATPSPAAAQQVGKVNAANDALQTRYNAAVSANDLRKQAYLHDSTQVGQQLMLVTLYGAKGKCGTPPYQPSSMIEMEIISQGSTVAADGLPNLVVVDPAKSAFTRYQFGMIRERIALYAMLKAGLIPTSALGKEGVFTDAELAALDAKSAELVKLAPLFKAGTLRWTNISDLSGW